jgi:hypothetical protein
MDMWKLFPTLLGVPRASAALALVFVPTWVLAQERHHPPEHMQLHEKFYSTWFMPDDPRRSCCNKADCYPTQVKFENGQWWALRREDQQYIPVPWQKVEINRNNPDGRNHLCAPPPTSPHGPSTVFCFALGGGI